jgi:hypothetical protein
LSEVMTYSSDLTKGNHNFLAALYVLTRYSYNVFVLRY